MCRRREGKAKILAREGRCAIVPHQEILVREAPTTWTDRETEKETCRGMKKERENDVKKERTEAPRRPTPPPFFSLRSTLHFTSCRVDLFLQSYRLHRSSLFIRHTQEEKRRQVANHCEQKRNRMHLRLCAIAHKSRQTALARITKPRYISAEKIFLSRDIDTYTYRRIYTATKLSSPVSETGSWRQASALSAIRIDAIQPAIEFKI